MNTVVREGDIFLTIDKYKWTFVPTKIYIQLDNLFNGNKELGIL